MAVPPVRREGIRLFYPNSPGLAIRKRRKSERNRAEGGKILREETETTMDENQIRAEGYFWIEKQIGEKAPLQEIVGEENENGISAGEAGYDVE